MAENVTVPGTGETLAFDDISGVKFARTKLTLGADGTNDGDVSSANPMPVRQGTNTSTTAATLTQGVKTVAAAGTPEALVGSATLVEKVIITATKGFNSANTGAVFVGQSSTNDQNYIRLMPWDVLILDAPPGKKIDLNQIYIDVVTNGDGVAYFAIN